MLIFCIFLILFQITISISSVQMTANNKIYNVYNDGSYSQSFQLDSSSLSCSANILYTYEQTQSDLLNNTGYEIKIIGINMFTSFKISTLYNIISPKLSVSSCTSDCSILIRNHCPTSIGYLNYFDTISLQIDGLQPFNYNVLCDSSFRNKSFQAGQLLIIVVAVLIITVTAIYSRAWAWHNKGVELTYIYIWVYCGVLVVGGVLLLLASDVAGVIGIVFAWPMGMIGICICLNQIIFKFRITQLINILFTIKQFPFRILDIISLTISLGLMFAWIFSNKNWIITDIISICIIVGSIKILKITSFKKALIMFLVSQCIDTIFIILLSTVLKITDYQKYVLNKFNNPFQIQLPTLNPVYGLKCSWLPIDDIIYPGLLISYFRRFDQSRNTKLYLITSVLMFFIGSVVWMVLSVVSPVKLPFGIIAEFAMILMVVVFAYNRKEIKILWNGKFYDSEFKNQEEQHCQEVQMTHNDRFKQQFLDGLAIDHNQDSSLQPIDPDQDNQQKRRKNQKSLSQNHSSN